MRLIVTEKNIAAKKIADLLADTKVKNDKVYNTPVYRFETDGVEQVALGLKGHILGVDFPKELTYSKRGGWNAHWAEGDNTTAELAKDLATPPWKSNRRPFTKDGLALSSWSMSILPYLIYAPVGKYPAEKDLIRSLKSLAKKADEIVIATDFDREGELIGSDARNIVLAANPDAVIHRARYSAITKQEITHAFDNLAELDDDLAQSGEARQDIDLIWGAVLTRYLTKARFSGLGKPRSAGRVQTPTLKLIVDKEAERDAFIAEDYWVLLAELVADSGEAFVARHTTNHFKVQAEAEAAYQNVNSQVGKLDGASITTVDAKKRATKPPIPLNTTALQAAAAAEGLSPARTMRIAESLYMNGLISYPRVDNTVYPASLDSKGIFKELEKVDEYRSYVQALLKKPLRATRGAKETTDHPPIHPTGAGSQAKLRPEEWKLYNLIARRFIATFSDQAIYEDTTLGIAIDGEAFVSKGTVLVSPGFRAVYPYGARKQEELPKVDEGDTCAVDAVTLDQRQTKPPARYGEGGIITTMEKLGLGTKSTRHSIIQTLIDRAYVQVKDKSLKPTMLGVAVIDALSTFADPIVTPQMTANLEDEMLQIAAGDKQRIDVVNHSRDMLDEVMIRLLDKVDEVSEKLKDAAVADAKVGTCLTCGRDLLVRSNLKTRGQFVGCAGWPDCEKTYPLPQGKIEPLEDVCEVCGAPRIRVIQFRTKPIERCLDPECETNYEPTIDLGECPVCRVEGYKADDGEIGHIIGQRNPKTLKRFARCTAFDQCNVSYALPGRGDIEPTGEYCKTCGAPEVVVRTARGPWRICIDMDCPEKVEAAKAKTKAAKRKAKGKKPKKAKPRSKAAPKKRTDAIAESPPGS
ncbi:MAG: DNA topoisomerase I [Coriobacteriia bacterium]|nr:DNA topoisomerase I [Coriobacteriia bacterium]